jgi:hypothetical protein
MITSISEFLNEKYNIAVSPGKKYSCVKCGKHTMSIKADDTLAKCFHPNCKWGLHVSKIQTEYEYQWHEILDELCIACYEALLEQANAKDDKNAYNYLTQVRNIHPKAIEACMIGVIPEEIDINDIFDRGIAAIGNLFSKASGIEREIIGKQLDTVQKVKGKLVGLFKSRVGWIVFFYTDPDFKVTGIRFRKPFAKEFVYCKVSENHGLFGLGLIPESTRPVEEDFIVLEGEVNLLQLQSLFVRNTTQDQQEFRFLNAVAIGSASNADYDAITKISTHPIFIHDADDAGAAVVEKARHIMHLDAIAAPEPYNDIDEYIKSFGVNYQVAWDAYSRLLEERKTYFRYFDSLEKAVRQVRSRSLKDFLNSQEMMQIIIQDLNHRGKFYYDGNSGYYFYKEEKSLMLISKEDPDLILLLSKYGLNQSEAAFRYALSTLENECYKADTKSVIHRFAYYNNQNNTLYVSNNNHTIFRITMDKIDTVNNGTDGVIFLKNRNWQPFELIEKDDSRSYFDEVIVSKINFESDLINLSEKRYLFQLWFESLFFESAMPTKPVITFIGEKGSGKSFTMRKTGNLLFGEKFDVTPLPNDQRDFDASVSNSYFIAIDNADSKADWFEDRIATLATGGTIKCRRLYSNNEMMEIETHCFLGITARTPHFRRDDIADRLIIMKVGRLEEFKAEKDMLSEITVNRNQIMTEVLYRLKDVLKALHEFKHVEYKGKLRMADFASFAYKVASGDNKRQEIEVIFDKMASEQSNFTLEKDPIADLLYNWVISAGNQGRYIEYRDLYQELKEIAEDLGEKFLYKNHRSFSQKLSNIRSNLESFFDIKERSIGGHRKLYAYSLKVSPEETLKHLEAPLF